MEGEKLHDAVRLAIEDLDAEQRISNATAAEALELLESEGYPAALRRLLAQGAE